MCANVLVFIDCYERVSFFTRIAKAGEKYGHVFSFLTDSICSHKELMRQGFNSYLLKRPSVSSERSEEYKTSLDVLNGNQSEKYAKFYGHSIFESMISINENFKYIFVWNGSSTAGLSLKYYAKLHGIKVGYFEISNLPNKLFVDPKGVNAKSWLYDNVSVLDGFSEVSQEQFDEWKEQWLLSKKGLLPQTKLLGSNKYKYYFDRIFSLALFLPFSNEFLLRWPKSRKKINLIGDKVDIDKGYVFLPLQVSGDSQLKINSNVGNLQAIDLAYKVAVEYSSPLFIKIHPAEFDERRIKEIYSYVAGRNIFIVNIDTNILIEKSKCVCVINSTVGLEAIILGKKVVVLGRAIYQDFNQRRLKSFIANWLVNIDYFSRDEVSIHEYMEIIKRIEVV